MWYFGNRFVLGSVQKHFGGVGWAKWGGPQKVLSCPRGVQKVYACYKEGGYKKLSPIFNKFRIKILKCLRASRARSIFNNLDTLDTRETFLFILFIYFYFIYLFFWGATVCSFGNSPHFLKTANGACTIERKAWTCMTMKGGGASKSVPPMFCSVLGGQKVSTSKISVAQPPPPKYFWTFP